MGVSKMSTVKRENVVKLAKAKWEDEGELEIDDSALISVSMEDDGSIRGAYVQAWVWVDLTPKEE
jgi:hypothetical protein